ncbi:MAG: nucleoside triphosphate pyrophosphohydrolase [Anaerolineales bacterium]
MATGITIVGLGPGEPGLLTRAAWAALEGAQEVYLRSALVSELAGLPVTDLHSFDSVYEDIAEFDEVQKAIVDRLVELAARPQGVVYAVPGDPDVGEATVSALRQRATDLQIPLTILPGLSFIDLCLHALGIDGLDTVAVVDALTLATRYHPSTPADCHLVIGQLHSQLVASDVKLTLLNEYPADHEVRLLQAVGTSRQKITKLPLHKLDQAESYDPWTSLYVPPVEQGTSFETFHNTVAHLRAPEGCPWDREQTHLSLRQHLLEEAYEALDALDQEDPEYLQEELGDLMLQLVIQVQIATESGEFQMTDVLHGINSKLIRRHPHVFGDTSVAGVDEVLENWESLKAQERADRGKGESALDSVPDSLPALAQADEYQSRARRMGFDWPDRSGVLAKVQEEIEEIEAAESIEERAAELGDLLFALVNYARWLEIDPEAELRQANRRFARRFNHVEQAAEEGGRAMTEMALEELDALWDAAKRAVG